MLFWEILFYATLSCALIVVLYLVLGLVSSSRSSLLIKAVKLYGLRPVGLSVLSVSPIVEGPISILFKVWLVLVLLTFVIACYLQRSTADRSAKDQEQFKFTRLVLPAAAFVNFTRSTANRVARLVYGSRFHALPGGNAFRDTIQHLTPVRITRAVATTTATTLYLYSEATSRLSNNVQSGVSVPANLNIMITDASDLVSTFSETLVHTNSNYLAVSSVMAAAVTALAQMLAARA